MTSLRGVVFLDTSVILSASIRAYFEDMGLRIEHKSYSESKGLINFFASKLPKEIGFTTRTIEKQSFEKVEKAVNDTLEETLMFHPDKRVELFERASRILDECEDNLERIINCLTRFPVDEEKVDAILKREVNPFFDNLWREYKKYRPKDLWIYYEDIIKNERWRKTVVKELSKRHPFLWKDKPIDYFDKKIISEVVYTKRLKKYKKTKVFLASLDQHLVPKRCHEYGGKNRYDPYVRDLIFKRFEIFSDRPRNILEELKTIVKGKQTSKKKSKRRG